jgi:hypothetical protein
MEDSIGWDMELSHQVKTLHLNLYGLCRITLAHSRLSGIGAFDDWSFRRPLRNLRGRMSRFRSVIWFAGFWNNGNKQTKKLPDLMETLAMSFLIKPINDKFRREKPPIFADVNIQITFGVNV